MLASTWDESNCMCFLQPHSTPFVDDSTLCLPNMTFTRSWCCHCRPNVSVFTSLILCNSRIYCLKCNLSQWKEVSRLIPHWSILPLNNWDIWLLTQTCGCVFTWLCQCHLELERAKGPSSFYLGHFSSSNFFDHITKDANILHLKSSDTCRLDHSFTSTRSKHTSHHHNQSIVSCRFLTYKYGCPTIGSQLWTWRFLHLLWANFMSRHFFIFFNFTPSYIFLI
jgi:hypothetical protein